MSATTEKTKTIHLLLIAEHALLRESISRLLSSEADFKVAQCATFPQAMDVLQRQPIDVVLLDFDPGARGAADFIRASRAPGLKARFLLLVSETNRNDESDLIRAGICGIFHKGDSAASLGQAIRHVAAGKVWFRQEHLQRFLFQDEKLASKTSKDGLTTRERQVLSFVLEGLKNKEIASRIDTSEGSVKAAVQQLFSKFGVRSRSRLVRMALERDKS